jgi:Ca2+-binding RTX toxin-like protein
LNYIFDVLTGRDVIVADDQDNIITADGGVISPQVSPPSGHNVGEKPVFIVPQSASGQAHYPPFYQYSDSTLVSQKQENPTWMVGSYNADSVNGGAGNDTIYGGFGSDTLVGGNR